MRDIYTRRRLPVRRILGLEGRGWQRVRGLGVRAACLGVAVVLAATALPAPFATRPNAEKGARVAVTANQRMYRIGDQPTFDMRLPDSGGKSGFLQHYFGIGRAYAATDIKTTVTYNGDTIDMPVSVTPKDDGSYTIRLLPTVRPKPGSYTVKVAYETPGGHQETQETFAWGVLAINTVQSTYKPGDTVEIQMGVLSSVGHTICDAPVRLMITSPTGQKATPEVKQSGVCNGDSYVEKPDYTATYEASDPGRYSMQIQLDSSDYKLTDYFDVSEAKEVPFVVARQAPTRLFPSAIYTSEIRIHANKDFEGRLVEQLPAGFTVFEAGDAQVDPTDAGPRLAWTAHLEEGHDYTLQYRFKPAPKSPAFYELQPLRFMDGKQEVYKESRQWQMAGDAAITFVKQTGAPFASAVTSHAVTSVGSTTGNTLIALIAINTSAANDLSSITDNAGNTWTIPSTAPTLNPPSNYSATSTSYAAMAYCLNCNAVTSVTVNTLTAKTAYVNVVEFSGIATSNAVDQSDSDRTATSATHSTPAITTTNNDDLIIGMVSTSADTWTRDPASTGYTDLNPMSISGNVSAAAYQVVNTTGTYQINYNLSVAHGATDLAMAFKGAVAATGGGGGGGGPITKVKETPGTLTTAGNALTVSGVGSTTGNTLIALVAINTGVATDFSNISDDAGNTWVKPGTAPTTNPPSNFSATSTSYAAIAYCAGCNAVSSVTLALTSAKTAAIDIVEFSNIDATNPVDQSNSARNGSLSTHPTPSLTTTNANDMVIGMVSASNDVWSLNTNSTSYTMVTSMPSITGNVSAAAYQLFSATGTYTMSFDLKTTGGVASSRGATALAMAFRQAVGCTPTTDNLLRGGSYFCSGNKAGLFWAL